MGKVLQAMEQLDVTGFPKGPIWFLFPFDFGEQYARKCVPNICGDGLCGTGNFQIPEISSIQVEQKPAFHIPVEMHPGGRRLYGFFMVGFPKFFYFYFQKRYPQALIMK